MAPRMRFTRSLYRGRSIAELPHKTERRLEIIPGATHLFEEPGALDRVAELARGWFQKHLKGGSAGSPRREVL